MKREPKSLGKIQRGPKQNVLTYGVRAYAKGIVDFSCEMTGTVKEKLRAVTTPCLPESNMTDDELAKLESWVQSHLVSSWDAFGFRD